MFTGKKKIRSNPGVVKTENRLLRLLKSGVGFQVSLASVDRKDQDDAYDESQKEVYNAMLEAEYQKAKAIMATQQARSYC